MVPNKSLDEHIVIHHLLYDAHVSRSSLFNARALKLTCQKVSQRVRFEGIGFLTKTLPQLGKCLDKALTGMIRMTAAEHGFETMPNSELPKFLGEFFIHIFQQDGTILLEPDAQCVEVIRQILYSFYKYEIPYSETQEQQVLNCFVEAEEDLTHSDANLAILRDALDESNRVRRRGKAYQDLYDSEQDLSTSNLTRVAREARKLLTELFSSFDGYDIIPRHGPGVVSTKERLSAKFLWTNVSHRITEVYPFDAYFCASTGHVCDSYDSFDTVTATDHSAQVLLVPKDSRGPRLISCEPVDFQWIQQGLSQAIYRLVEGHVLTKHNVFFTDQGPNQRGALLGSSTGRYATLDLKEASDRVSVDLVHLLFPENLTRFTDVARSVSTVMPSGQKLVLRKFAPMGSALCFPMMALSIWSLLTANTTDADTRESILVYGDDVIVPTAYAASAMAILEAFGLKINHAKSCTQGSFRESCGVDAFQGVNVTPVRFRTVWDESPRPDVYTSWIAYANQLYDKRRYSTYNYIVGCLEAVYGPIPDESMNISSCPHLRVSSARKDSFKRKTDKNLQRVLHRVRVEESSSVIQVIPGWNMLLRYFTEAARPMSGRPDVNRIGTVGFKPTTPFAVSEYTRRHSSILVWRWR